MSEKNTPQISMGSAWQLGESWTDENKPDIYDGPLIPRFDPPRLFSRRSLIEIVLLVCILGWVVYVVADRLLP